MAFSTYEEDESLTVSTAITWVAVGAVSAAVGYVIGKALHRFLNEGENEADLAPAGPASPEDEAEILAAVARIVPES